MKGKLSISLSLAMILSLLLNTGAFASVGTDRTDYPLGSVVTIRGDNGDGAGFLPGETVQVEVSGPNGYADSCQAAVDETGAWSCQVTLPADETAVGVYAYTATGQTSGASQGGGFNVILPSPTEEPTVVPLPTETASPLPPPTEEPMAAPPPAENPIPLPPPFIQSDRDDYFMGELVTLTSGNWQAGELVHLFVNDDVGSSWGYATDIEADANGAFTYSFYLPNWFVAIYRAVATGPISGVATTTFTDAAPKLFVAGAGTGSGTVTSSDTYINCTITAGVASGTCNHTYGANNPGVTLTAAATTGTFSGWNGGGCTGTGTCAPSGLTGNNTVTVTATFTAKSNQTITVTTPAPANAAYNASFSVAATASSGLSVAITTTGVCTGNGTASATVTMTSGTGTCTVHFNQAGNTTYNPAPEVTETVNAQKIDQAITFGALASKTYGDADFSLSATASSGLSVSFNSQTVTICTVSANTVHILTVGTCTIRASQGGNANYNAAPNVDRSFNIQTASSATVVTCGAGPFTYSGSAITPCTVSVTGAGGLNLTPDPDYTNNVNAGTASASYTYAGDANHTGSNDLKNFTIGPASSTTVVTCGAGPFTYSGSAITPCTVSVTGAGGLNLTPDPDYTNNVNAGTASASYTYAGDANHTGSNDLKNFTIGPASSTTVVTCGAGPFTYTGSAITPCTVSVTGAGGLNLTPDPVYADNVNVGTATASYTYTGDANHTGSNDSKTFAIGKATSITVVTCGAGPFTYTGSAITPCTVSVTGTGGLNLTPDPDYTNNVNAGTAIASYTYAGDDNHTGSNDLKNFTIGPASSTTVVTCGAGPFTYTGSAITPCTVSVTGAGGLNLTPDPVYTNNVNAGTAIASYTYAGDDNHTGSNDLKNFTIDPATSTTVVTCGVGPFTYTGSAITPCTVSVTGAGGLNLTPDPVYADNVNAGTASASYTFAGDANHTGSNDLKNFTIDPASSATVVTCGAGPFTYTGSAITPCTVSVTGAGGLNLTPDPDYTNNVNAGTASASYTYTGDANHTGSNDLKNFTIDPASSATVVTCGAGPFTYSGLAQTPCTVSVTGAGGLNLTPDPVYADNINAGTASASYTYTGDANHTGSNDLKNFTIDPAASTTVVTCGAGPFTYTGSAITPCTVSVTGAGGLNLTPDPVYADNINAGTASASYTYTGDANHTGSNDLKNFTIDPASSATVVTCGIGPFTYTGSAITPCTVSVTGAGGLNLTPDPDYTNNVNAGTAIASYTYTGDENHSGSNGLTTFEITKADSTVTVTCPVSVVYSGSAQTPCTAFASGVSMSDVDVTASLVYGSNIFVGSATADASWDGDDNHTGNIGSGGFAIIPADTTTTAADKTAAFGDPLGVTLTATVDAVLPSTAIVNEGTVVFEVKQGSTSLAILPAVNVSGGAASANLTLGPLFVVGSYDIYATYYPASIGPNFNGSNNATKPAKLTIAKASTTAAVTVTPGSQQYSDQVTFVATISPAALNGVAPATGVTFKVGTQVMGSALLVLDGTQLKATLTAALLETVSAQMAPGSHTVTAVFTGVNSNFTVTNPTTNLTITKEDARAYYTGNMLFWGATATANSANVTLPATIKDITAVDPVADPDAGDIRNAKVTFLSNGSPISGCTGLAVSLVNAGDIKVGTVVCNTTLSIGSSGATSYTIGIQVNNYYTGSADTTIINVAQPVASNFITGGGYLVMSSSAGKYAGSGGSKSNFGFNVKYNKGFTNLQGNVNIIFTSGGKVYQIKSNSLQSLGVSPAPCSAATLTKPCTANFVSKSTLTDITNPLAPISLGGNLTLQMQMTDKGEPGSSDSIGFALYDGSKLLFASAWNGTKITQQVLTGGNLVVH